MLAFDKARHKARYRRGLAYEGLGRYENALADLKAVVRLYACSVDHTIPRPKPGFTAYLLLVITPPDRSKPRLTPPPHQH